VSSSSVAVREAWSGFPKRLAKIECRKTSIALSRPWRFSVVAGKNARTTRYLDDFNLNAHSLFGSEESLMDTIDTALFTASAFTQPSTQERAAWDVQMARNSQASSTITLRNQCSQTHTFTVTEHGTPFLQTAGGANRQGVGP